MTEIEVGEAAPDFVATTEAGETIRSADLFGERTVVLFFYPMDGMPVCTAEACSFRDAYEEFVDAGAEVIGVSGDSEARHRDFAERHRLPFRLISDRQGTLRNSFGIPHSLGLIPKRVTFVIDRERIVRMAFSAVWIADEHVRRALEVVKSLEERTPASDEA